MLFALQDQENKIKCICGECFVIWKDYARVLCFAHTVSHSESYSHLVISHLVHKQ